MLNFFGENLISKETYIRRNYVNLNFDNYEDSAKHIKLMLNKKLNELNIRLDQNKKTNQEEEKNKIDILNIILQKDKRTTLMIKNIPNKLK